MSAGKNAAMKAEVAPCNWAVSVENDISGSICVRIRDPSFDGSSDGSHTG